MKLNIQGMVVWVFILAGFFASIGYINHDYRESNTEHIQIQLFQQYNGVADNSSVFELIDSSQIQPPRL